jgi:hypothetical protein
MQEREMPVIANLSSSFSASFGSARVEPFGFTDALRLSGMAPPPPKPRAPDVSDFSGPAKGTPHLMVAQETRTERGGFARSVFNSEALASSYAYSWSRTIPATDGIVVLEVEGSRAYSYDVRRVDNIQITEDGTVDHDDIRNKVGGMDNFYSILQVYQGGRF